MLAVESYERAVRYHRDGKLDEALLAYEEAVRLDAGFQPAWYAQGCAWEAKGDDASALACFERAVAIAPQHAESQHNLGKMLHSLGLCDEALDRFRRAIAAGKGFLPRTAIATVIPGCPGADNLTVLEERRRWAETHLPPADRAREWRRAPPAERKVRVGYLGSFFDSDNWMKPVWGLVNRHDRSAFAVHLFSDAPLARCLSCYQLHAEDQFHDISALSNRAAADEIERLQLDLLVDLNGYSRVGRLAVVALRPAPIVVGWFNAYATSGMACYDYIIGDAHVIPPEEEPAYTETVVRVPGCYLTFDVRYLVPPVVAPPVSSGDKLTFGSLTSLYKITPPVVAAWSRILRHLPEATLLLKNAGLTSGANREHLWGRFEARGIPRRRIMLEGRAAHFDYLTAYERIDIALDTFPYNGGTTTSEAIWQGVPVLTFRGDRWASRQSTSILRAAALDEFVAETLDDYVERAFAWGRAPDTARRLTDLRFGMRSHLAGASICDTTRFAKNMEGLYTSIIAARLSSS